jgi:hypothetical protein
MLTHTKIINGPSKLDLMLALFVRNDDLTSRMVSFHTEPGTNYSVTINGISLEDGSRESFLFSGYINLYTEKVRGWYNTQTRRGWIEGSK